MPRWKALAQRIRMEMDELERTVSTIARHWQSAQATKEHRDAFLNSVALNLHSFYNGLERALELVATVSQGRDASQNAYQIGAFHAIPCKCIAPSQNCRVVGIRFTLCTFMLHNPFTTG